MTDQARPGQEALSPDRQALLRRLLRQGIGPPSASIPRIGRDGPVLASFAQERMWFLDQLDGGPPQHHVPVAVRLRGPLDERALDRAFGEVVRRHESLRTTFALRDGAPVQVIGSPWAVEVPLVDVSAESDPDAAARRLIAADVERPFDLARGPLLRTLLLRLGEREHVLLFDLHHAVYDAWSIGLLLREIGTLYGAFRAGRPSPLPELPIQYADYAAWQRDELSRPRLRAQVERWRARLAGAPELVELAADRPRPPVLSHRGATHLFEMDVLDRLEPLSRQEGVTLFMVLLAGFGVLLHRCAGAADVVVGTSVANRERPEVADLIGLFINTLALRLDLSGGPTFRQLVARVRQTVLDAFADQDLPFEQLVRQLQPERGRDRTPLFQVALELHDEPAGAPAMAGLDVSAFLLETGAANFDLHLRIQRTGGRLRSRIEYRRDLFEAASIERMAGRYERLLLAAAADPDGPIDRLALLGDEERRLLETWSAPAAACPPGSLPDLFEAQARRTPAAAALRFEGRELTYGDVSRRSGQLARRLRRLGVGTESRVGVLVERSLDLVPVLLGTLAAGAAFVPLDPDQPPRRLAAMLEDAGVHVVVTGPTGLGLLPEAMPALCLDRDGEAPPDEPEDDRRPAPHPDSLCYVVCTSGTTGRPKAVAVTHRCVSNFLWAARRELGIGAADRVLALASPTFDIAVLELLVPLTAGATVVVAPPDAGADGRAIRSLLEGERITVAQATPATWRLLLASGWRPASGLRTVCTGEALPGDLADVLAASSASAWNLYGPSETWYTTVARLRGDGRSPVSIGTPVPNCTVHVLGPGLEPAPVGAPGELYVGGAHVARGYLGRPDVTAERFLPDPFGEPGARLYRTGDLGLWRPDGELAYLGRADRQVQIRGHRIEPGEIEAALRAHPEVRDAAVVAREVRPGEVGLVAYVVTGDGGQGAGRLRRWLSARLPEPMVPASVVRMDALPLTANGKLDRASLPPPVETAIAEPARPATAVEAVLCRIWEEVLGRTPIGVDQDFFALGGHSLLAARMVARARDALGVELSLRAIFEAPTVARLAERLELERGRRLRPPLRRRTGAAEAPLSFAQERLWFLDLLEPGLPLYNQAAAYRLRGQLRPDLVATALDGLVARHEVLRSRFETAAGRPRLAVVPELRLDVRVEDLSRGADPEAAAAALADEEAARAFDLSRGPLLRARLLRLGPADHVLLLTTHHIVSDGVSQLVIERELSQRYVAALDGPAPLPLQYADYAAWQREWLRGDALEGQLAYWRERLRDVPGLRLPADRRPPGVRRHAGAVHSFELPVRLTRELWARARELRTTPYTLLLAAYATLLRRCTGQSDVAVGTPVDGRGHVDLEQVVGLFVGTLVLRLDLSGDPAFSELVGRVADVVLDAHAHQDTPFERLVEDLQPEREVGRNPLFQVWFVLQDPGEGDLRLSGVSVERSWVHSGTARFDLTLSMRERESGLAGAFEYSTELFEPETVERLAGQLGRLLEGVAADPERRLSRLPLLDAGERRLLAAWSAGPDPAPPGCWHHLFEARAASGPDRPAVRGGGVELGYGALDARANRLAHRLRRLGVGLEGVVGLLLESSADLVVAMVAVLKAGGAFLPLDPEHPAERIRAVLRDAGAAVLVTRRDLAGRRGDAPVAVLDLDEADLGSEPASAPAVDVGPDNLAYVIYTSGSTGRPKGVAVPHRGLPNLVAAQASAFGVGPDSVVFQFASPAVDAFVAEVAVALGAGAALALPAGDRLHAAGDLAEALRSSGATVVTLPPALLAVLPAGGLDGVRTIVSAGETCTADLVDRWAPGRRFVNAYGPTEATVCASLRECHAGDPPTIGRPLPGVRAYVLDGAMEQVPRGVLGELYLGGAGVARGYAGRPGQTAARFVPDPFGGPGGRLYRTGDLARWVAGGELEHRGRVDEQLKVRGFLVEPAEVEARLREHPGVASAAVVERGGRLVGHVVGEVAAADLRTHLAERLPAFMVPAAWALHERLPLTAGGKVDRRALPDPGWGGGPEAAASGVPGRPASPVEEALARIWAEVLGVDRVGPDDSFFALGGDSILSIQVVARARHEGLVISPRQVFDRPTVRALAAVAGRTGAPREDPRPLEGEVALTPIQRWFLDAHPEEPWHFNQALWLHVPEGAGRDHLERALGAVAAHHDALRLRFERSERGWTQRYGEPGWRLRCVDLTDASAAEREAALTAVATAEQAGLDLAAGPLLAGALVEVAPGDRRLLLVLHHLVVDTVSWGVLAEDVGSACDQARAGRPIELPPPSSSFRAWSERLGELARAEAIRSEAEYWRAVIGQPRPPAAGDDRVASESEVLAELDAGRTRDLREALAAYRAEMPEALLAALGWALGRWSGGREWLAAMEGHGREDVVGLDATRTVGWLACWYPLRLAAGDDVVAVLRETKERARGVPSSGIGYGLLRYTAGDEGLAVEPEVAFNYLGQVDRIVAGGGGLRLASGPTGPLRSPRARRRHPLEVLAAIREDRLRVSISFSAGRHRRARVEALAGDLVAALQHLAASRGRRGRDAWTPSDFPAASIGDADLRRILARRG